MRVVEVLDGNGITKYKIQKRVLFFLWSDIEYLVTEEVIYFSTFEAAATAAKKLKDKNNSKRVKVISTSNV